MIIFIEQPDDPLYNEAADTLSQKLAEEAKDGAIIKLTTYEFQLMKSAHIVDLASKGNNCIELIEMNRNGNYIAICSEGVCIDDIIRIHQTTEMEFNIIRIDDA